jgi:hypothetical protein
MAATVAIALVAIAVGNNGGNGKDSDDGKDNNHGKDGKYTTIN